MQYTVFSYKITIIFSITVQVICAGSYITEAESQITVDGRLSLCAFMLLSGHQCFNRIGIYSTGVLLCRVNRNYFIASTAFIYGFPCVCDR